MNKKEEFYELMDKVETSEQMSVGDNFIGHVGIDMVGFGEVDGGFRIGQVNDGEIRLLG